MAKGANPEPVDEPLVYRDQLAKLKRLRREGYEPYARGFKTTHTTADAAKAVGRRKSPVRVAGRLMGKRYHGGTTFADLFDGVGRIQLMARKGQLGEPTFRRFGELDSGDIVGVIGPVFKTRTGDVTIEVREFELLSKALRPPPAKWVGLKDVEQRYRQRYADLIANADVRRVFRARARVISAMRRDLDNLRFLEVETPVLQEVPGGGHARPFVTHHHALKRNLYLRIALELHLKRLVVGGFDKVYEIARVFRNEGLSPRHNPEFTMLECYEAFASLDDMMALTEDLIDAARQAVPRPVVFQYQGQKLSLKRPFRRASMVSLIEKFTGRPVPKRAPRGKRWGVYVNELFEEHVQPELRQPTFVFDYPADVSPLARSKDDDPRLVERFELIVMGREIANAFNELTDPLDQRRRFEAQAAARAAGDLESHPFDADYIRALEYGLPPTGGLGIGIDRLVMLLTDQASIRDVILFPQLRGERSH